MSGSNSEDYMKNQLQPREDATERDAFERAILSTANKSTLFAGIDLVKLTKVANEAYREGKARGLQGNDIDSMVVNAARDFRDTKEMASFAIRKLDDERARSLSIGKVIYLVLVPSAALVLIYFVAALWGGKYGEICVFALPALYLFASSKSALAESRRRRSPSSSLSIGGASALSGLITNPALASAALMFSLGMLLVDKTNAALDLEFTKLDEVAAIMVVGARNNADLKSMQEAIASSIGGRFTIEDGAITGNYVTRLHASIVGQKIDSYLLPRHGPSLRSTRNSSGNGDLIIESYLTTPTGEIPRAEYFTGTVTNVSPSAVDVKSARGAVRKVELPSGTLTPQENTEVLAAVASHTTKTLAFQPLSGVHVPTKAKMTYQ